MEIEEIQLWIEMSDELGDATDANVGRFALLRDRQAKEKDATIADLRERHEAFVRKVRMKIDGADRSKSINRIAELLQETIALCDAELGKKGK